MKMEDLGVGQKSDFRCIHMVEINPYNGLVESALVFDTNLDSTAFDFFIEN